VSPGSGSGGERLYRVLLRLLPAAFRREAEDELVEIFRDARRHAAEAGARSRAVFWARTVADVLVTATAERAARGVLPPFLARDLRFAARRLRRRPGRTAVAAGTLGLGVAATLVMLVLVRDILLRPLPFERPDRLVRLVEESEDGRRFWPSLPNVLDWREHATALEGVVAAAPPETRPIVLGERSLRASVSALSDGFLGVLGVQPARGRGFGPDENRPGGAPVAMVSWSFWRGPLGGRPLDEISFLLGTERFRVVGVLPPGFRFLAEGGAWGTADVWTPLERGAADARRTTHGYHVVGRLARGTTLDAARTEMDALAARLKEAHGEPTHADRIPMTPLLDEVVGGVRGPLRLLLAAAAGVLLVACLNVAAALLAQGLGRGRELAVRMALGADRAAVSRQLLVEGALLAIPGFVTGAAGAWGALRGLRVLGAASLPRLDSVSLGPSDLLLGAGVATAAALAAALLPALLAGRTASLRTRGAVTTDRGQQRLWSGFVAGQVALTTVLLVGCGLLLRSFRAAVTVDRGYRVEDVLGTDLPLPPSVYTDPARRLEYFERVLRDVRALPGVRAAGLTSVAPDAISAMMGTVGAEDATETRAWAAFRRVDPGFFEALDIPLLRGDGLPPATGGLASADDPEAAGVLVDRFLARALWPGEDAVGRRLEWGGRVAGVVGSVRSWDSESRWGAVYVDYRSDPESLQAMHLVVACGDDAAATAETLRATLTRIDPLVPLDVRPLSERLAGELADRRLLLVVAGAFALAGLALAPVGVYAVVSFAARRRVREAAVRLALGARPEQVSARLVARGMRPAAAGLATGLAAALPAATALRSQLFGVARFDPFVFAGAAVVLACAAALATWVPARRAGAVAPAVAFREG
jgi:predicted permease